MKLEQAQIKGVKFWHRPGFSDLKTFEEVIDRQRDYEQWQMSWFPACSNVFCYGKS